MHSGRADGQKTQVTSEGWVVTDLPTYRFLMDHPPPRPYGLVYPLRDELRDAKALAFWIGGLSAVAVGIALQLWLLIPIGMIALGGMLRLYLRVARAFRSSPLLSGVVTSLARHPGQQDYSTARARLPDGREIPVALLSSPASALLAQAGWVEVLLLEAPQAEYSVVVGVRGVSPETK